MKQISSLLLVITWACTSYAQVINPDSAKLRRVNGYFSMGTLISDKTQNWTTSFLGGINVRAGACRVLFRSGYESYRDWALFPVQMGLSLDLISKKRRTSNPAGIWFWDIAAGHSWSHYYKRYRYEPEYTERGGLNFQTGVGYRFRTTPAWEIRAGYHFQKNKYDLIYGSSYGYATEQRMERLKISFGIHF